MTVKSNKPITLTNVRMLFPNFRGEPGQYNKKRAKTFAIALDEELALKMANDGFNVKWPKPKDEIDPEEDHRTPYLSITVTNDGHTPVNPSIRVYLVDLDDNGMEMQTQLQNDNLAMIDDLDISHCNVIINPYVWTIDDADGPKSGVKAYLKGLQLYLNTYNFDQANY